MPGAGLLLDRGRGIVDDGNSGRGERGRCRGIGIEGVDVVADIGGGVGGNQRIDAVGEVVQVAAGVVAVNGIVISDDAGGVVIGPQLETLALVGLLEGETGLVGDFLCLLEGEAGGQIDDCGHGDGGVQVHNYLLLVCISDMLTWFTVMLN